MAFRDWLKAAAVATMLMLSAATPLLAGPAASNCFAANGLVSPKTRDTTVGIVDASTALTAPQKQQARELLAGELRPGTTLVVYTFARGPGQDTVQRVGTFGMPMLIDDPWKVTTEKTLAVNNCVRKAMTEVRAEAVKAIDIAIESYTYAPDGESPVVQAIIQVVASHPAAGQFIVITDGLQHQAGYSLYDANAARGPQALKKIDPRRELENLARIGTPAMTRAMHISMFPIGQMEPGADGKIVRRRLASEVDALIQLWSNLLDRAGAGQISVTSFVPGE